MFSDLIDELEVRLQNLYASLRSVDLQRENLTRQITQIQSAIQALRRSDQPDRSDPLPFDVAASGPASTGQLERTDPFRPRPTRDAVRGLLRDHGGDPVTVQQLVKEMTLLGWLHPNLKAPTEAVRYAAKMLAKEDPNVERISVATFRWMPDYPELPAADPFGGLMPVEGDLMAP